MTDIVIKVVEKVADYTVAPLLRQCGYLIYYESNVEDLTMKVTTLTATRDGVQLRVDGARRNLEVVLPEVENWLEQVRQTIQEKETCFQEGRVAKATTCCSSNGWCPNLKGRHSLSRKAAKMAVKLDKLITEGNFGTISCPAPPPKLDYPAMQYYEDSTQALVKPHEGASSSSGTSKPAEVHVPMDLSERLEYRLPYTKELLTALQDDKISMIGIISETFREIDTVTTKEFTKRMKHRNLFDEVVMAVVSQHPDLKRIQDEIAEMLDLKLEENGSLVERAERLRALLPASGSKRILVILTDVCGKLDLDAIGIPHLDIMKSCKIVMISELQDVFGELGTQSNFRLILHSTPGARAVEFESRISVIRDVMDALTDDVSNPIVIWGMGGIGKTTLVTEIGAKADEVDLFDEIAIAEFTQEPDLFKIQGQIAKALGLELTGEEDRAAKLRERLSRGTNNVLLILDNVWTQLNLNLWEIGIPISRDRKCCKLLVTSRDQDIFKEMKTRKPVPIGGLPKPDGWSLFKKVAGDSIESDLELRPIAEQVLAECGGLPVAISTVGRALQGESISSWRNALTELGDACPENVPGVIEHVYGKIKFSYECLPSEQAKSCFLLCCLFPESGDFLIEALVYIAIGLGLLKRIDSISQGRVRVETLVGILKSRSLLLDGDEEECVRMHDVVRDVAVYIASEEFAQKKNDESEKRIMLRHGPEVNKNNFVDESGSEESAYCRSLTACTSSTELLLIAGVKDRLKLRATIFDGMEDLKVLLIWRSLLPSLPLLKNIQTLLLMRCHLNFNVDVIGELRALMILDLSDSDIKQLPDTFKNLSNLRVLHLSGCGELKVISPGVISSLSRLEELHMWRSFQDWVVEKLGSAESTNWISQLEDGDAEPEQVDMWKRLNRLAVEKPASTETTTDRVSQLEDDESSKQEEVNKLFRDFVDDVYKAEGYYDQVTRWANSMDWRVGLLSELLSLSRLTTLEVVLPPIEIVRTSKLFHNLDRFKISIGWQWYDDLDDLDNMDLSVEDLDVAGTGISLLLKKTKRLRLKTKNLTDPLNVLDVNCGATLKSLTLDDCDSLEYLIDTTLEKHTPPSVFPVLGYLRIEGAKRLKEIFHGDLPPGSLQKLETLWLYGLPELTNIWTIESQSRWMGDQLAVLESITIQDCQSIEAIFGLEGSEHHVKEINFLSLTDLVLKGLPCFTGISKSRLNRQLEVSSLYRDSLTDEQSLFSDPKVIFPVLRKLYIERLGELKKIWDGQLSPTSFSKLERLTVKHCDKLLHLVPTQMQNRLQTLKYIEVEECSSLEGIFEVSGLTVNERNASVSRSDKLPSNISQPDQGMQINDIMGCRQSCQGFQNLTDLYIASCGSLRYLLSPSIARGLVKLQTLKIKDCQKMEAIVTVDEGEDTENESMLPRLDRLGLQNLTELCITSCGSLRYLLSPSIARGLVKLQTLQIEDCQKMEAIVAADEGEDTENESMLPRLDRLGLQNLTELCITSCGSLRYLLSPSIARGLVKLQRLGIKNCQKMEAIVAADEGEDTENESMLPRLDRLGLQNLTELCITSCGSLRYLLSPSIARGLVKLQTLQIEDCQKMEAIVAADEGEDTENESMLPRLDRLGLQNLTELCITSCGSLRYLLSPSIARGLVKLQRLGIKNCQKMEAIVAADEGEDTENESMLPRLDRLGLQNLTELCITSCGSLRYLLSPSIARGLVKLQTLQIEDCQKMEAIVAADEGEDTENESMLPRLDRLGLQNLTELCITSCGSLRYLLSPSIARGLVKLQRLGIKNCQKMEAIVAADEGEDTENESMLPRLDRLGLQNLTELCITSCGSLRYLLSPSIARGLVKLQTLQIEDCQKMEAIVAADEGEDTENESMLPRLDRLGLQNLTELCITSCGSLRYLLSPSIARGLVKLQRLGIKNCQKMEAIVAADEGEDTENESMLPRLDRLGLQNLTELCITSCGSLRYLLSPSIARGLVKLQTLQIEDCQKMEAIVAADEGEDTENESMLPRLDRLGLQNLTELCITSCGSLRYLLSPSIARGLVKLQRLGIKNCQKMEAIVAADEGEDTENESMLPRLDRLGLQNLTELYITSCGSLRYLLSPSIARGLVKLQILQIEDCQKMEAIVAADEGEETENESMLPRLYYLHLINLPNLGSFSQGRYTFDWPLSVSSRIAGKQADQSSLVQVNFSSDYILREQYKDPWNEVRIGKLLEDLDALAGTISVKPCYAVDTTTRPLVLVTASVDKIVLKKPISVDIDLKIVGAVIWVGRSSIEIQLEVTQSTKGCGTSDSLALSANFIFVARDSKTGKAAPVNRLLPETEREQFLFKEAEARNNLRKRTRGGQKREFENGEVNRLESLLAEGRIFCDMPALADRDSILLRDTSLENSLICQPQQRNIHGRIFGGFLMHRAFELAFSTAYAFAGLVPCFPKVDLVDFLRPVDVGDFLRFKSCVLYTEVNPDQPLITIEVVAHVTRPELRSGEVSNTFYFTFTVRPEAKATKNGFTIQNVVPAREEEARRILERKFCGCEESQFAEFQTLQALGPLHFIEEQDWRRRCFVKSKMMWMKTEVGGRTEDVWFNIFPDKIRIIRPNQSG
ncbi:hypothetical protein ACLB2K_057460 [Fragaria x ananassa]